MVDTKSDDDRRRDARAPIGVIVRVETDEGGRHYYSKNLSAGGAYLLAEDPLTEETIVEMELFLPLVSTPVKAKGEVVWKQRQEPSGFAVKFTEIGAGAQKLIRWVVGRYLGRPGDEQT
jgi:hypothetical protein